MSTELTLDTFAPAVGDAFTVGGEGGATVELLLVEATQQDLGEHAPRPAFSLPNDFDKISLMPTASSTARSG